MKNPNWPAYVSISNGRVVYRPRVKEAPEGFGIDSRGFLKPPIKLGKPTDSDDLILSRYLEARRNLQIDSGETKHKTNTLFWIRDKYLQSSKFKELAKSTQSGYEIHLKVFLSTEIELRSGKILLGSLKPVGLTLPGINTIKERLISESESKGQAGTSYVNGHIRAARAMMTWAMNHIERLGVPGNPFKGISLGKENQRDRYVTDDEYMEQYLFAVDHAPEYLPLIFEHCYLLACRSIEATGLKVSDANDDGYIVRRTKGSKDNLIIYTDRLLAARDATFAYRKRGLCQSCRKGGAASCLIFR